MPYHAEPSHDRQKDLLSSGDGHFSLVRALHMADYITEMNGMAKTPSLPPRDHLLWFSPSYFYGGSVTLYEAHELTRARSDRFLRCHVRLLLSPLLSR
jgi:hypothetical protein